jgi:hypothetical protein
MSVSRIYIPGKLVIGIDNKRRIKVEPELLQRYLEELMLWEPEMEVEISIVRVEDSKSTQQLRYFYGVILPVIKRAMEELQGETLTKEEVIMFLKDKYFYEEVNVNGSFTKFPLSLSKATKEELSKFIYDTLVFSRDILGVNIPEPH